MATYAMIVASDAGGVIGIGNKIPWHHKEDLKRFKIKTTGCTLIMGRNTWESIGRPLPNRNIIVVTSRPLELAAGVTTVSAVGSFEAALEATKDIEGVVWIAGGASIYKQAMEHTRIVDFTLVRDHMLYSNVPDDKAGVVRFPTLPPNFMLVEEAVNPNDEALIHRTYVRDDYDSSSDLQGN